MSNQKSAVVKGASFSAAAEDVFPEKVNLGYGRAFRRKWSVVMVVYFGSVVACINQFKVPPVAGMLMQQFHADSTMVGWMMSIFNLTGILLAFPAAILLRRLGPKKSGLVALGCIMVGCVVGATAAGASAFMIGRVIEGIGLGLMCVVAPAVIAMHVTPQEVGLPMGIWATWLPMGAMLGYNLSCPVVQAFGSWRGSWWFGAVLAAVAFVLHAAVVGRPADDVRQHAPDSCIALSEGVKNSKIWLLALSFFFMLLGSMGFLTWAPHYLAEAFKLSPASANFYASIGFLWGPLGGIVTGWGVTKYEEKGTLILMLCAVLCAATYPFAFMIPQSAMVPFLSIIGFVTGCISASIFSMVPKIMGSPALAGVGMSIVVFMQGGANLLAAPALGHIISDGRYSRSVLPTLAVHVLSFISVIAFAHIKARRISRHADRVRVPIDLAEIRKGCRGGRFLGRGLGVTCGGAELLSIPVYTIDPGDRGIRESEGSRFHLLP